MESESPSVSASEQLESSTTSNSTSRSSSVARFDRGPDRRTDIASSDRDFHLAELERLSRTGWYWFAGFVAFVVIGAIVGGLVMKVPQVALVPGAARDTEPLIEVSGIDQFPSDGELLYTTVSVRRRPNLWEYLWLQTDDDTQIVPEEVILGDQTPEENREFNLELMRSSKQIAIAVALEELGYDAVRSDAVLIVQLVPDTPAFDALTQGESILAIDGEPTEDTGTLVDLLKGRAPGEQIELTVQEFGQDETRSVSVVLAENPENPSAAFLGIQPTDRLQFEDGFDFEIDIDSGSVGGPSAGLAFTLALLDQLTEGELTGGAQIAVTGTINEAGAVGPVGGVIQKTAAVRDLGVDAFIVPAGLSEEELEQIAETAGDDLEVIPVNSLEEALAALDGLGGNVGAVEEFAAANPTPTGS